MKNHTKVYYEAFGYHPTDFVPCEICGVKAVDVHHIDARGMGGSKEKDTKENLMAVCREDHIKYGDKKQHKEWLKRVHKRFMRTR
jgi:hypothetical protein